MPAPLLKTTKRSLQSPLLRAGPGEREAGHRGRGSSTGRNPSAHQAWAPFCSIYTCLRTPPTTAAGCSLGGAPVSAHTETAPAAPQDAGGTRGCAHARGGQRRLPGLPRRRQAGGSAALGSPLAADCVCPAPAGQQGCCTDTAEHGWAPLGTCTALHTAEHAWAQAQLCCLSTDPQHFQL